MKNRIMAGRLRQHGIRQAVQNDPVAIAERLQHLSYDNRLTVACVLLECNLDNTEDGKFVLYTNLVQDPNTQEFIKLRNETF